VTKFLIEFFEMLYHQYVTMKDLAGQQETAFSHCETVKKLLGDMSTEYAQALYLKAKSLYLDPSQTERSLETIRQCLHIWRNTPLSGGPKDLNHALALLLKASILGKEMKQYYWALKLYRKAALIVSEIKGAKLNLETLLNNIEAECGDAMKLYECETGETVELDELSEEEDADVVADNQF